MEFDEKQLLLEILKSENNTLEVLIDKMTPIFDLFSAGIDSIGKNSIANDCNLKVLDSSLIIFLEIIEILKENRKIINIHFEKILNKSNDYEMVLSLLLNNLLKHILAYRKIYSSNFIVSANILLRSIVELSELITAILYKPELLEKYLEYSGLLANNQENPSIWYNDLSPSKIKKILAIFDKESCEDVDISNKRKIYYNYLSKDTHNELLALSFPEEKESIKILLTLFYIFFMQINFLLFNKYQINLVEPQKTGDYILHLKVFYLLFKKINSSI